MSDLLVWQHPKPGCWTSTVDHRGHRFVITRHRDGRYELTDRKRSDTKPEVALLRALHARGLRFRKDLAVRLDNGQLVRPDIAFTRCKLAVFVDGCFWHSCPQHGQIPATNQRFWSEKLSNTVNRDRLQEHLLNEAGWVVIRIWEHQQVAAAAAEVAAAVQECRARRLPQGAEVLKQVGSSP